MSAPYWYVCVCVCCHRVFLAECTFVTQGKTGQAAESILLNILTSVESQHYGVTVICACLSRR